MNRKRIERVRNQIANEDPLAPACQGHQGCVITYNSFFNNYRSCFLLSSDELSAVICSQGRNPVRSAPPDPLIKINFHTRKSMCFNIVFKAQEPRKKLFPRPPTIENKSDPKFIKRNFCGKLMFTKLRLKTNLSFEPQASKCRLRNRYKRAHKALCSEGMGSTKNGNVNRFQKVCEYFQKSCENAGVSNMFNTNVWNTHVFSCFL